MIRKCACGGRIVPNWYGKPGWEKSTVRTFKCNSCGKEYRQRIRVSREMKPVEYARVIHDTRDGSKDKFIPLEKAKELYESGKLKYDLTNRCYTV